MVWLSLPLNLVTIARCPEEIEPFSLDIPERAPKMLFNSSTLRSELQCEFTNIGTLYDRRSDG